MNNQRVKAFTIMEVTITMLVAALLIGITYSIYTIVIKSYHSFKDKNDKVAVLVSLDHVLKRDFVTADTLLKDSDGFTAIKDSTVIKYSFYTDFVLRKSVKIDTFKVKTQDWVTAFENIPVKDLQPSTEQNRLDEFDFTAIFENEKIPFHYRKLYSSENLIQRNPNAIH